MKKNDWNEMPESMKAAARKDRDLWLDIYGDEIEKKRSHAKAETSADQNLEMLGKFTFDGKKMNNSLVEEMQENDW